ncbi:MAG TPA: methylmalonyl-CoA epimerase [Acidimicrobiales bacterium]|nr:methylmalonyl-CoA epimerase [Acidimicrobiales bacterium]
MLTRIAHVAVAVSDLEAAVRLYTEVWGLEVVHREVVEDQGVEEVLLRPAGGGHDAGGLGAGTSQVQLLGALGPDTTVGRFLERRGEGLHHIAYEVDNLEGALRALREAGVELIDEAPRRGSAGTRVAFVHPRGNRGVLTELVEVPSQPPA